MILLADANVLIDLWHVRGLTVLPRITPAEVLDVVLGECDEQSHPGLHEQVAAGGIRIVEAELGWWEEARSLKSSQLSHGMQLKVCRIGPATDLPPSQKQTTPVPQVSGDRVLLAAG